MFLKEPLHRAGKDRTAEAVFFILFRHSRYLDDLKSLLRFPLENSIFMDGFSENGKTDLPSGRSAGESGSISLRRIF